MAELNESICVVADEETVVLLSEISPWFSVADTVANPKFPDPSVFNNWFAEPSDAGITKVAIFTEPEPLPDNSKWAFDWFDVIVLSFIVTPSRSAWVFAVNVVNVPAAGVVAPITVLSTVPLLISTFVISIPVSYTHLTLPTTPYV